MTTKFSFIFLILFLTTISAERFETTIVDDFNKPDGTWKFAFKFCFDSDASGADAGTMEWTVKTEDGSDLDNVKLLIYYDEKTGADNYPYWGNAYDQNLDCKTLITNSLYHAGNTPKQKPIPSYTVEPRFEATFTKGVWTAKTTILNTIRPRFYYGVLARCAALGGDFKQSGKKLTISMHATQAPQLYKSWYTEFGVNVMNLNAFI